MQNLPIYQIRQTLLKALTIHNRVIISAETGSGKSTQLPQFILDDLSPMGKILVLQPRRLAAMMLAHRVAEERKQKVGEEVGFLTRFESAKGPHTKILYLTDGLLLRFLQNDPLLSDIEVIIFDEFHERTLASDLGLALITLLQKKRQDLKIVVMSATLNLKDLKAYLGPTPVFEVTGRLYPIKTKYLSMTLQKSVWEKSAELARDYLMESNSGDILIFMPGYRDIQKTLSFCQEKIKNENVIFLPLYGEMTGEEQKKVMQFFPEKRKIIVATTIAETSLTIPGIRLVIDSGLVKIGRYNALQGINSLLLEKTSKSSAEQRMGRAGREAPGECIRLWTKEDHSTRLEETEAEIFRTDLSEVLLLLAGFGISSFTDFPWYQAPLNSYLILAQENLINLGALSEGLKLTDLGKQLLLFSLPPQLSYFLLEAKKMDQFYPAALWIAIYSEQNGLSQVEKIMTSVNHHVKYHSEVLDFLDYLYQGQEITCEELRKKGFPYSMAFRIVKILQLLCRQNQDKIEYSSLNKEKFLISLLKGFSNHLIYKKNINEYELANGRRGSLPKNSLFNHQILLALNLREFGEKQHKSLIFSMLSEIKLKWLEEYFYDQYSESNEIFWDDKIEGFIKRHRQKYCGLTINETLEYPEKNNELTELFYQRIKSGKLLLPTWNEKVDNWIKRVQFLANLCPELHLINYDEMDMQVIYEEICSGATRLKHLKEVDCLAIVKNALSWQDQQLIEKEVPERIKLPSGHYLKLTYEMGKNMAKGRARIADLYDLQTLPLLAKGKTKILLDILAPNWRTVQVTDDLPRFWQEHYPKLKKELAKRYPKHQWR